MNNLKYFRNLAEIEVKELSGLLGVSVYTCRAYEEERMIMNETTIKMICKIFNIEKQELFLEKEMISAKTINKLLQYASYNKVEKIKLLVFNLSGKYSEKLYFSELSEIKSSL